jgi:hypothetical protein
VLSEVGLFVEEEEHVDLDLEEEVLAEEGVVAGLGLMVRGMSIISKLFRNMWKWLIWIRLLIVRNPKNKCRMSKLLMRISNWICVLNKGVNG